MKHKSREYRIEFLIRDLAKQKGKPGRLNLDFSNQRSEWQWSKEAQSLLIHTILQGEIIPEIFVTKDAVGEIKPKTVIDGKQRVSTIFQYYEGCFPLHKSTPDVKIETSIENKDGSTCIVEETIQIAGKKFNQLDERLQDIFLDYDINVREIAESTPDEISEQMFKLNNGKALSAVQRAITRLNINLAQEIEKISKNEFFTERVEYTSQQIKNDTGKKCVLQSLVLYTGKDYTRFDPSNMNRLALEFNNEWSLADLNQLNSLFVMLNQLLPENDKCKEYLTPTNIPILIMNVDKYCSLLEDEEIATEQYRKFLEKWFEVGIISENYTQYEGRSVNTKTNIEGRIDTIEQALVYFMEHGNLDGWVNITAEISESEQEIVAETFEDTTIEIKNPSVDTDLLLNDVRIPIIDDFRSDIMDYNCFKDVDLKEFNTKIAMILSEKDVNLLDKSCLLFRHKISSLNDEEQAEIMDEVEYYLNIEKYLLDELPPNCNFLTSENILSLTCFFKELLKNNSLADDETMLNWFKSFIQTYAMSSYMLINNDDIVKKGKYISENFYKFMSDMVGVA